MLSKCNALCNGVRVHALPLRIQRFQARSAQTQTSASASPVSHPASSKGDPSKNPPTKTTGEKPDERAKAPSQGREGYEGKEGNVLNPVNPETPVERPNQQPVKNQRYEMKEDTGKIPLHQGVPLSGDDVRFDRSTAGSQVNPSYPGSEAGVPRSSPRKEVSEPAGTEYQGSPYEQEEGGTPGPTTLGGVTSGTGSSQGGAYPYPGSIPKDTESSAGVGTPTGTTAAHWTITTVRRDHDLIKQNLERLLTLKDNNEKQRVFNDTVKALAQHDVAEEVVFYPSTLF